MTYHCTECLRPCQLHNITYCATCHNHAGECDFGGCFAPASTLVDCYSKDGRLVERRPSCSRHANRGLGVAYGSAR